MVNDTIAGRAREYAKKLNVLLGATPLGFGDDGAAWTTSRHTVVKVFERGTNYARELECYQRLAEAGIRKIREFEVPALLNHDDALQTIEIGFVNTTCLWT
jgi:hypothetical protein